ncbi:MAG: arylamine N-acetyltransferase [Burkholderiales bacterium]|nr:arylamine N-acetyltransferase [Burkholderiales bacterium]
MNLDAYLRRIRYDGPSGTSPQALASIVRCHAMAIPFENLAVLASGPPDLDPDAVEAKLVGRRRGGYCFEQNHLLLAALREIGFAVEPLAARVRYGRLPGTPAPRTHMVLRVHSGGRTWLADAGFGNFTLTAPVDLSAPEPQDTPHERVRVAAVEGGFLLQILLDHEWRDVYGFDLAPQLAVDYVQQNWFTGTFPGGLFTGNVVVTLPKRDGRCTLFNRTLTRRSATGEPERTTLGSIGELSAVLDTTFGLRVEPRELAVAWNVGGRAREPRGGFE